MGIPAEVVRKRDLMVEQIRDSLLDASVKEESIENLISTAESTNGLKPEEKIQAMSINQFEMARSDARIHMQMDRGFREVNEKLDKLKPTGRYDMIVQCRWQIMTLGIVLGVSVAAMLIMRPELAEVIRSLTGKG